MTQAHRIFLILFFVASLFSCAKKNAAKNFNLTGNEKREFYALIFDSTSIYQFIDDHSIFQFHKNEILQFYRNRSFQFAWFNENGMVEQANNFLNLLNHFDEEGIKDSIIYLSQLNQQIQVLSDPGYLYEGKNENTLLTEFLLTAEFFVYAEKVWGGMSEKQTKDLNWYIKRKTIPYVSILDSILTGKRASFTAYEPVYAQYNALKPLLKKYKLIAKNIQSWENLKLEDTIKFYQVGDSSVVIKKIKERLILFGDLEKGNESALFDSITFFAVKNFQKRYGLKEDGAAGKNFLERMNISPDSLVQIIEINMERCRWVPLDLKGEYITVNIPDYKMSLYDADTLSWQMNVIVGKASTSTTIFNDELEYIVFSPYWVVTPNIVANELLPAIKKNISYLSKNHMEVVNSSGQVIDPNSLDWNSFSGGKFPYKIRQTPGAHNSLGWVKFIFPNNYSIYFHDTPSRNLFAQSQRNFSHGCIRVAEPKRFAEYLLRNDSTWTTNKIDSVMYSGKETRVTLKEKIPVFIAYFTAWVDPDGNINFRKDIYGHDALLQSTLQKKPI